MGESIKHLLITVFAIALIYQVTTAMSKFTEISQEVYVLYAIFAIVGVKILTDSLFPACEGFGIFIKHHILHTYKPEPE